MKLRGWGFGPTLVIELERPRVSPAHRRTSISESIKCISTENRIKQKKEETMGNRKETPLHNVISLRISNQELATIRALADQSKQSTSDFMRDALSLLIGSAMHSDNDGFTCPE